tara:strand:- start:426 stop:1196 length:771 start_codon:yes stop_codon:yes gene_type:complete
MVKSYFTSKEFSIIEFNSRFIENNFNSYVNELNSFENAFVINCIGRIKQKSEDAYNLLLANSILPLALARSLKSSHILIHPSTDCVFDGLTDKSYNLSDFHSASDVYGWSKSLGETALINMSNALIVRVSIIGPDSNSNKGLLSWFLNNPPGTILNGFTNHFWNGITTLEWCKKIHEIIINENTLNQLLKQGLVQLGTKEIYSKYEMLCLFKKIFQKDFEIKPLESKFTNRCLLSLIESKPLEIQLNELRSFKLKK